MSPTVTIRKPADLILRTLSPVWVGGVDKVFSSG